MWTRFALLAVVFASLVDGAVAGYSQSPLQWQTSLENAKRQAAASNQLVLIHFWAPYCGACRRMDEDVFPDARVAQVVQQQFIPVKLNSEQFPATANQFGVTKLPTDVIITPNGQVVKKSEGYLKAPEYAQMLTQVAQSNRPMNSPSTMTASIPGPQPGNAPYAAPGTNAGATPPMGAANAPNAYMANPYTSNPYAANSYTSNGYAPNNMGAAGVNPSQPPMGAAASMNPPVANPGNSAATMNRAAPVASAAPSNPANPYSFASTVSGQAMPPIGGAGQQAGQAAAALSPAAGNLAPPAAGFTPPVGGFVPPGSSFGDALASRNVPTSKPEQGSAFAASASAAKPNTPAAVAPPASSPSSSNPPSGNNANAAATPPLALDGFCPVELQERHTWVRGDKRWGVIHLGKLYLFAGAEQWQRFFANPEKYAPVLSGMDIVAAVERNQFVAGDRRYGGYFENRLYLFNSEENLQKFDRDPQRYATAANQQFKATPTNRMR